MAYACEVYEYNKLVIAGGLRPNLVERFSKIAQQFNDMVSFTNLLEKRTFQLSSIFFFCMIPIKLESK